MSSRTMHHGGTIFAERSTSLSAQYGKLAEVWCQSANIAFQLVSGFFFSHRPKRFWNNQKKFHHFSQKVWKHRL